MKHFSMLALAVAAVVASIVPATTARGATATPSVSDASIQSAIVAAVERDRRKYGGVTPIPGVLIGVWDGSGHSFTRGFGYADLEAKRPLTAADHFRIGSNTKTFVVSVLLQLIAEKKLTLDDPVSHFSLGIRIPNGNNITVRELCNMRSGLFEAYNTPQFDALQMKLPAKFDPRMLIRWAVAHKPYFAPNGGYHYSNTNYLLLGLIVEDVTKDSVGNQIRKRLIEPFRLANTTYPSTEAMPGPWARGYGLDAKRNWEDVSNTVPVQFMGAAGEMVSNMADVKKWIKLYSLAKTGGPPSYTPDSECKQVVGNKKFGLAINCTAGWYGYTGGLPGYNTADYYYPAGDVTIVAWVTYQALQPPEGVATVIFRDIARIMTPSNVPFVYTEEELKQAHI
ncbi:MAG TPA: serine hydrolase domain-containing protein [Candidatus Tumulicola sp.]